MKVTFLGTNGWYDTDTGNTVCTLIDSEKFYLILDAGNGIYKIDRYIKEKKPIYLFISHLHIDHIEGLHILNKFKFQETLSIYGRVGIKKELNKFINDPFTMPLNKLPYPVSLNEVEEGNHSQPFPFTALKLFHSGICLGYRFHIEDKILTYCSDTGICDNDLTLSEKADLLIHECSFKEKIVSLKKWGHVTPEEAAALAKSANVNQLVLTHFEARSYLTLKDRQDAVYTAKKIFNKTIAAIDDMQIKL